MDTGLLIIRVVLGSLMAAHGAQKLFGWFGGHGLAGTSGWLESMGFRPGRRHAAVTGTSELGGGLLLALGLVTPLGAAAVAGVMIVAIATVHLPNGFFNSSGGYEFNLLIAAAAIALAVTGPGAFSIDNALDLTLSGYGWGLASLGVAAVAGAGVLAMRRTVPAAEEEQAAEEQMAA
jgi:putative oxidoreductase